MKEQFVNLRQTNGDIATRLQLPQSQSRPPREPSPSLFLPFPVTPPIKWISYSDLKNRTWRNRLRTRTTDRFREIIGRICMRVTFIYPIWTFVI